MSHPAGEREGGADTRRRCVTMAMCERRGCEAATLVGTSAVGETSNMARWWERTDEVREARAETRTMGTCGGAVSGGSKMRRDAKNTAPRRGSSTLSGLLFVVRSSMAAA